MWTETQGSRGPKSGNQSGSSSAWTNETSESDEELDLASNRSTGSALDTLGTKLRGNKTNSITHRMEPSPNSNTASPWNSLEKHLGPHPRPTDKKGTSSPSDLKAKSKFANPSLVPTMPTLMVCRPHYENQESWPTTEQVEEIQALPLCAIRGQESQSPAFRTGPWERTI